MVGLDDVLEGIMLREDHVAVMTENFDDIDMFTPDDQVIDDIIDTVIDDNDYPKNGNNGVSGTMFSIYDIK